MWRRVLLSAVLLCACGTPAGDDDGAATDAGADGSRTDGGGGDGGAFRDGDVPEGGAASDASAADARPGSDGSFRLGVELDDGTEIIAERVAIYDHAEWWTDPSDERTWALFRHELLAPWPDDRSMVFVRESRVARTWREPATTTFQVALRGHGLSFWEVPLRGVSYVITAHESYHLEENGYGDFAWDLVRTDGSGARFTGDGTANEDYLVWDEMVFAPADGYVVEVVRDAPDNVPGSYELGAPNNMIGLQIYGGYYLYLLHFRQDTIPATIAPGVTVERGAYLGRVGNSGVTAEPHLHITALALDRDADPLRTWSVPSEFRNVWVAGERGTDATRHELYVPSSGEWIGDEPFTAP